MILDEVRRQNPIKIEFSLIGLIGKRNKQADVIGICDLEQGLPEIEKVNWNLSIRKKKQTIFFSLLDSDNEREE